MCFGFRETRHFGPSESGGGKQLLALFQLLMYFRYGEFFAGLEQVHNGSVSGGLLPSGPLLRSLKFILESALTIYV